MRRNLKWSEFKKEIVNFRCGNEIISSIEHSTCFCKFQKYRISIWNPSSKAKEYFKDKEPIFIQNPCWNKLIDEWTFVQFTEIHSSNIEIGRLNQTSKYFVDTLPIIFESWSVLKGRIKSRFFEKKKLLDFIIDLRVFSEEDIVWLEKTLDQIDVNTLIGTLDSIINSTDRKGSTDHTRCISDLFYAIMHYRDFIRHPERERVTIHINDDTKYLVLLSLAFFQSLVYYT